jgi:acyl-CoA synthetase (NDP forming)
MYDEAVTTVARLVALARARDAHALLEPEGYQILEAVGIRCPRRLFARDGIGAEALETTALGRDRVVVKVVAPHIAHKSDAGGVAVVLNERTAIGAAVRRMERTFSGQEVAGYSVSEFIPYDPSPGGEWLLGLRWTEEFGPVVTLGPGGVSTECLTAALQPGRDVAVFSPFRTTREQMQNRIRRLALTPLATGAFRKQSPRTTVAQLCDAVSKFCWLAPSCRPDGITDLEINPLVPFDGELIALDVLASIGSRTLEEHPARPVGKIHRLLNPGSIAIVGVSAGLNPGHVILNNVLREGFDRSAIFIVKPGATEIEGCQAVPTIRSLPRPVDLLILSVSAAQVPDALIDVVEARKAESVIVIPGGLGEKAGTEGLLAQAQKTLRASRDTEWKGPVVNGGNCLGIQSRPGRYDTMFIPGHKLGAVPGPVSPLALISQSGAFAVSRATRLAGLNPKYSITVGNQMDLTIGDYLRHLEADADVVVFGIYVEGFRPLDGRVALDVISRITASGRVVVVYRGGRTTAGTRATASHTAAIAGDYTVSRDLARASGAIVADSLEDFTDLVRLFALLRSKPVYGRRVGAISNAGYECVAIADNIGGLELPEFTAATGAHLVSTFERARIDAIVDVHNPLDLTPMTDDEGYEAAVRRVIEDGNVDVGVVGCVPATPALNTLAASPEHGEDVFREGSVADRLVKLKTELAKPWIAIVDAGALYDPFAQRLQAGGVPTFRSADRAMQLLNVFVEERFAHTVRAQMERWVDEFSQPATRSSGSG